MPCGRMALALEQGGSEKREFSDGPGSRDNFVFSFALQYAFVYIPSGRLSFTNTALLRCVGL